MRFSKFLLPLALVAQTGCASGHCSAGEEGCSTIDESIQSGAGEWLGGFTGLVFLSKTLFLESLLSDSRTAGSIGFTIIQDMKIGTDILLALTLRTRRGEMVPFDMSRIEGPVMRNFDTWGIQTATFLGSLQERAALFRESNSRVGPQLATKLKEFKEHVDMFCDAFGTIMPNFAPNITRVTGDLARSFESTIDSFDEQ